ncbi:F0F1 ATP synthase subunit epsilon [Crocosphaera sp. XPORK-15E]|uniref:F0F1 ATP synthase subunit epsilon n=1 Tax=Crocosphaera sp. XPORK-15E TaxID=3110247 RepID=UPI002B20C57F|nr:F0F1 ATP synthase subunit epsilon [Crocosphaera sp. XPORK-15E]MEA5534982.1 F0F1 ATP synthase subunit epsilon [Crocosphaera sp. XPORK-15E]
MNLKVLIPTEVFIDTTVTKIVAEAENGSFCLLPHHIDFVAALVPGILCYTLESNQEIFLAINEGILVKCGDDVFVSTLQAVADKDLETLKQTVETKFRVLDERERLMRSALAQFEATIIRRFQEIAI